MNTHSLIEVFKAGIGTTKWMCTVWNGNWFTVFLFTLMPEVFVPYSYWIFPILIILAVIGATTYFIHEIAVKRLGFKWYESITIAIFILIATYQFTPSTKILMYWPCSYYVIFQSLKEPVVSDILYILYLVQ